MKRGYPETGSVAEVLEPESSEVLRNIREKGSIDYRQDIDGLRAIAVLLVLIFHGGLALFPSGFIGVDIFFVISGYLTTAIILKSLSDGNFTFYGFYTRRIWRLQPAVIALLVVTLIVTTVLFLPDDYIAFLKSEKYTSLLISNQYFSKATDGYATPDASSLPLLHTWSLAIEWQWYLVLPLAIWLLNRFLRAGFFKLAIYGLTIVTAALALYLSNAFPDKSYYFFTARIFELMIGSCAVILNIDKIRLNRVAATCISVISLAVIFYCAMCDGLLVGFPNGYALAVCLATAALLSSGIGGISFTSKLLAIKPLVFTGRLSYSLYLWHWPVLAVMSYLGIALTPSLTIFYFAITFLGGYFSFVLVENKFRKARVGFWKTVLLLMVLPAIFLSILHTAAEKKEGWTGRFGDSYSSVLNDLKAVTPANREKCLGASDASPKCVFGALGSDQQVFLMGDSYSNHYWGFVDQLAKDANLSVLAQGYPACLALPGIYLYDWYKFKDTLYKKCHDAAQRYFEIIKKNNYKYVIIGQFWEAYVNGSIVTNLDDPRSVNLSNERLGVAIREALNIIVSSGAIPVFLENTLEMPAGINECLSKRIKLRGLMASSEESDKCRSVSWNGLRNPVLSKLFKELQTEYPSLVIVDPKSVQCKDGSCMTIIDEHPVYRDIGHMTDYASYRFGKLYLDAFGNPLK